MERLIRKRGYPTKGYPPVQIEDKAVCGTHGFRFFISNRLKILTDRKIKTMGNKKADRLFCKSMDRLECGDDTISQL